MNRWNERKEIDWNEFLKEMNESNDGVNWFDHWLEWVIAFAIAFNSLHLSWIMKNKLICFFAGSEMNVMNWTEREAK